LSSTNKIDILAFDYILFVGNSAENYKFYLQNPIILLFLTINNHW